MATRQKPKNGRNGKKNGRKRLCPQCFIYPVQYGAGPKDLCGVCRPTPSAAKRKERKGNKRAQVLDSLMKKQ